MSRQAIFRAIEWCLGRRVPFAAFRQPGRDVEFWASPSVATGADCSQADCFFASRFNAPFASRQRLPLELDAEAAWRERYSLPSCEAQPEPLDATTDRGEYVERVGRLIADLAERGHAKTVISVAFRCNIAAPSAAEMAMNVLEIADGCFNSCFYHPKAGFWMGSTPETLLSISADGTFRTMALAGTAPIGCQFTEKDKAEHQYVVDYIDACLDSVGIEYKRQPTRELPLKSIAHLCTEYQGKAPTIATPPLGGWGAGAGYGAAIIDALNPTPALCGFPKDLALADIAAIERHSRRYYGGLVGVERGGAIDAFVNIRCANFCGTDYCLYSGGGIVADSDANLEWLEAQAKRLSLLAKMMPNAQ